MSRRTDNPDELETATDVNAEMAETVGGAPTPSADQPTAEDAAGDEEPKKRYRVETSIAYPAGGEEKRAQPGDEIDDISDEDAAWLLEDGHIVRI